MLVCDRTSLSYNNFMSQVASEVFIDSDKVEWIYLYNNLYPEEVIRVKKSLLDEFESLGRIALDCFYSYIERKYYPPSK